MAVQSDLNKRTGINRSKNAVNYQESSWRYRSASVLSWLIALGKVFFLENFKNSLHV